VNSFAILTLCAGMLAGCASSRPEGGTAAVDFGGTDADQVAGSADSAHARARVRFVNADEGAPVACRWMLHGPPRDAPRAALQGIGSGCDAELEEGEWTLEIEPLDPLLAPRVVTFEITAGGAFDEDVEIERDGVEPSAAP
jgi:hypothetical protein